MQEAHAQRAEQALVRATGERVHAPVVDPRAQQAGALYAVHHQPDVARRAAPPSSAMSLRRPVAYCTQDSATSRVRASTRAQMSSTV